MTQWYRDVRGKRREVRGNMGKEDGNKGTEMLRGNEGKHREGRWRERNGDAERGSEGKHGKGRWR